MIVKFYNNDSCYMIDGVTSLQHHYLNTGELPVLRESDWNLTENTSTLMDEIKKINSRRIFLNLGKKGKDDLAIITYAPIYIMNNEGKTIETIN